MLTMHTRNIWTAATVLLLLSVSTVQAAWDCTLPAPQELRGGLTVTGIIHPVDETVTIQMVYEGQGWLGIGRSDNGKMIGGEAVIGLTETEQGPTNPGKYQMVSEENSGVYLFSDARQTLQDANIVQDDTTTTLMFTKKLFEDGEYSIPSDSASTWIYGVGRDNSFPAEHARYGTFDLQFPMCVETSDSTPSPTSSSSSTSTGSPTLGASAQGTPSPAPAAGTTTGSSPGTGGSSGTGVEVDGTEVEAESGNAKVEAEGEDGSGPSHTATTGTSTTAETDTSTGTEGTSQEQNTNSAGAAAASSSSQTLRVYNRVLWMGMWMLALSFLG
jgi:hypothetical protein